MRIDLPGITGSGEVYMKILRLICGDGVADQTMVDLMCHKAPYTPLLGFGERTYVDIQDRKLDHQDEQKYFVCAGVFIFLTNPNVSVFDVSICSDGIEHLTEESGYALIDVMEFKSEKQILFTPLGEYMVTSDVNDVNPDSHRSGWTPEMLPEYLSVVLPDFHPALNTGAFFAVNCSDEEKTIIYNKIKQAYGQD